jgi:zinc finger-containing ubiquitin peptidase 1
LVHDFDFQKPPYAQALVKYVDEYFKCTVPLDAKTITPACQIIDRPPLYFQHSGHSRTIVGIEHLKSGKINFILFDPSKSPSSKIKDLAKGVVGKKNLSADILKPYRVSLEELAKKKEYQILRYHST